MKVAVLFSGLVREGYKDTIKRMNEYLPDADFYYTTWKGHGEYDFIDHYFDETHIPYNCERHIHFKMVQKLRALKEENNGVYPKKHKLVEKAKWFFKYENRVIGRNRVKQHLAHSFAYERCCKDKNYDIIIKCRYDLEFEDGFTKGIIRNMVDLAYDKKVPVGLGLIYGLDEQYRMLEEPVKQLADLIIAHHADMFDPAYVMKLLAEKTLKSAEGGWYQILCEPYSVNPYQASNKLKIVERL